jgi:hypothetical protein
MSTLMIRRPPRRPVTTRARARAIPQLVHPLTVGVRVRVERDETRYPSKGTWPEFRGRTGTVVEINVDQKRPRRTEYGVVFGKVQHRTDGRGAFSWSGNERITWFGAHEITSREVPQRHAGASRGRALVGVS